MIVKMRIDDRLLHGQVAYSWKSALSYQAIVIASDEAAGDEIRKAAIKMCCPDGVKLAVRTVAGAAELLKNPQLANMKVFVIAANPKSLHELTKLIDEKPTVNLGGIQSGEGRRMFAPAVYLNQEDVEYLDKLEQDGYSIEVQEVPSTAVKSYSGLRTKFSI